MTISPELFMSILSMDSYNRGYNAGFIGLGESGQIGDATIVTRVDSGISNDQYLEWQSAGFYAVAYDWNGETVISYRGTDNYNILSWDDETGSDLWNGYLVGAGGTFTSQAHLATEFYQAVTGTQTGDPTVPNITVVGHPSDCRATGGS